MGAVLLWLAGDLQQWLEWGVMDRAWNMGMLVVSGGGIYVLVLVLMGMRPSHLKNSG